LRRSFISCLTELAADDPRVVLLTGDLGFTVVEPFAERFPDRFFNVGVAEQNLIGVATGLAEAGYTPYAYSIATFAALRPYEFFRNGPVRHGLPVRLIGTGGGFEYGAAGHTHHALEDLGVMRLQPGLTVLAPADHEQARAALIGTRQLPGPVYYRLGKDDRQTVPGLEGRFALGRVELLREGRDLLLLSLGTISRDAAAAAAVLAGQGLSCAHGVVATLAPARPEELAALMAPFPTVITAETHYATGALGSLAAEVLAERGLGCRLVRCGVGQARGPGGSRAHLERKHGLSVDGLVAAALGGLDPGRGPGR
jgi:transketolase